MPSLNIWMNGALVGEWTTLRTGTPVLRYAEDWAESPRTRPLSLSLPITANLEVRGPAVDNYFDNLLPDSRDIRRRIRDKFQARSMAAFDLLTAIGRDCVGAVQVLPPEHEPLGWDRIDGVRLSEADIEHILRNVTSPIPLGRDEGEAFRISIAGTQEKTALLSMGGAWFQPRGATPTTHILKLPLGIIGGFRGDFSDSIENEWFCARLLRELDLPVVDAELATFGEQKVLVVTRFDRRWIGIDPQRVRRRGFSPARDMWIARLPQEDFCQATGRPPSQKYESAGGPSINESLVLLAGSEYADRDRTNFVLAQLVFWLLAAIDGHGKNFSIYHQAGGTYGMTPLYDVLSAWPIIGSGANQLPIQRAKLAMAVRGRTPHYRLSEIRSRHWHALAERLAIPGLWARMRATVESVDAALERVEAALVPGVPERVIVKIREGVRDQARGFLREAPA